MALKIIPGCISCDVCVWVCPNQAITAQEPIYLINPSLCDECQGHADEPQCVALCPVSCIIPDLQHPYEGGDS